MATGEAKDDICSHRISLNHFPAGALLVKHSKHIFYFTYIYFYGFSFIGERDARLKQVIG